jgi:CheY-like chemotaxis protein
VQSGSQVLNERAIDCVVVGSDALDSAIEFASDIHERRFSRLPVILYDESEKIDANGDGWQRLGDVCTVRRAHSPARLFDLTSFFLHSDVSKLSDAKQAALQNLHRADGILAGRHVLIVDDDMRNIFALSAALEEHDMQVRAADNGHDAIAILQEDTDIEIVLMDIMMPELDGMETIREIRKVPRLKNLPIVAVTAKAMKGDREKCIEAGAWDYLSKPVDIPQVLAVLRAWLHHQENG